MRALTLALAALLAAATGAAAQGTPASTAQERPADTAPSPPLLETTWVVIELAGVPVPLTPTERQPSLQFVANGSVSGSDGCNRLRATYERSGAQLTFGPIIATRMACEGLENLGAKFAAALERTVGWRLSGRRLQFFGKDGVLLAAFEPRRGGVTAGEEPPPASKTAPTPPAAAAPAPAPASPPGAAPSGAAPLRSAVFDWVSLKAVPIPNGERRQVLDGPTETVDLLHVHVTSLAVGKASGEPVRHLQEEVLIVKDGEVEVSLDGRTQRVGPGAILFFAAGAVTALRNVGTTPATYYVVYYRTPRTPER